ncbi:MAG: hypothetical protein ACT4OO_03450 [Nitrospiraceae bacterium]
MRFMIPSHHLSWFLRERQRTARLAALQAGCWSVWDQPQLMHLHPLARP